LSPDGLTLAETADLLHGVEGPWTEYLARATDEEIEREVEYQSLDAGRFRNRMEDILTQLFGHSWYHRGQIAMLVRACGREPAVTDLVYWCREEVPSSGQHLPQDEGDPGASAKGKSTVVGPPQSHAPRLASDMPQRGEDDRQIGKTLGN
jgi:hypothetical protein